MSVLAIILAVVALVVIWIIFAYNTLVKLVNQGKEAWADIQVQLKRRYDLIPNLVQTAKGYATHESGVFEKVTQARTAAMGAVGSTVAEEAQAENMLSGALKSLFAVSEAYPDLKANENFLHLQKELADTEDKIQASRRFYNSVVMALSVNIESFPSNIIASAFSFAKMDLFELSDAAAAEPVKVQF